MQRFFITRFLLGSLLSFAAVAQADEQRVLVMALGECSDPLLTQSLSSMQTAVAKEVPLQVIGPAELRGVLGNPAELSVVEIQRTFESAQAIFSRANYREAEGLALEVLRQLERIPPDEDTMKLTLDTSSLLATVYRGQGRLEAFELMLRRILQLSPGYQLHPSEHAPSVRARFETLRERLSQVPKHDLVVSSNLADTEVFVDGRSMGRAPLMTKLPEAVYRVVLVKNGKSSLLRTVELNRARTVNVDMAFEIDLDARKIACLNGRLSNDTYWSGAAKLAAHLQAQRVVVVRVNRVSVGPSWLSATLLTMPEGRKVREGGVKLPSDLASPQDVAKLAQFVLTGERGEQLVADTQVSSGAPSKFVWKKAAAVAVGATGLLLLGLSLPAYSQASTSWSKYDAFYANGNRPTPQDIPELNLHRQEAEREQAKGTWLLLGGSAAAVGGTLWYLLDNGKPPPVSVAVSPSSVTGVWTWTWP